LNQLNSPLVGQEDIFDADTLRRLWVRNYCKVSYKRLIEEQQQIMNFHKRVGTFGLAKK
jgi:hypothetical protein